MFDSVIRILELRSRRLGERERAAADVLDARLAAVDRVEAERAADAPEPGVVTSAAWIHAAADLRVRRASTLHDLEREMRRERQALEDIHGRRRAVKRQLGSMHMRRVAAGGIR